MGKKNRHQKNNIPNSSQISVGEYFEGPIPHPSLLNGYENIHSGLADRIVAMAEKQSAHRQYLEKEVVTSNIKNEKMGIWLGFLLTLSVMIGGIILLLYDKNIEGWIALFAPAVFQGWNYYQSRKQKVAN